MHNFKVDDIFVCSWGYDQTNIDFYKVKKVTDKSVYIVAIESRMLEEQSDAYNDAVVPYPAAEGKKVMRKVVKQSDYEPYIKITSYANGYKWNGKPGLQTNAYYGR